MKSITSVPLLKPLSSTEGKRRIYILFHRKDFQRLVPMNYGDDAIFCSRFKYFHTTSGGKKMSVFTSGKSRASTQHCVFLLLVQNEYVVAQFHLSCKISVQYQTRQKVSEFKYLKLFKEIMIYNNVNSTLPVVKGTIFQCQQLPLAPSIGAFNSLFCFIC